MKAVVMEAYRSFSWLCCPLWGWVFRGEGCHLNDDAGQEHDAGVVIGGHLHVVAIGKFCGGREGL